MSLKTDENLISKYNDANLSIMRLHDIWIHCRQYIKTGNLEKLKVELDNIWIELYNDVTRQKNHEDLISQNNRLRIKITKAKSRAELYFALLQRAEFLKNLQDKAGKAGVYVDEHAESF